jgi:hypothetical protein
MRAPIGLSRSIRHDREVRSGARWSQRTAMLQGKRISTDRQPHLVRDKDV